MIIDELLGYEFTCRVSTEYKDESWYTEDPFTVTISKDSTFDSGYRATIKVQQPDSTTFDYETDPRDGEEVAKLIFFENWTVISKKRI